MHPQGEIELISFKLGQIEPVRTRARGGECSSLDKEMGKRRETSSKGREDSGPSLKTKRFPSKWNAKKFITKRNIARKTQPQTMETRYFPWRSLAVPGTEQDVHGSAPLAPPPLVVVCRRAKRPISLVCNHAPPRTVTSGAETTQGGVPVSPTPISALVTTDADAADNVLPY